MGQAGEAPTTMFKWFRQASLDPLSVSMAGVKLGDRVLVVGCGDARLIAALAAKAGLSGRACAVDESPDRATEAARVTLREGALVETSSSPPTALSFEAASFDLVVLRDALSRLESQFQILVAQEALRVLRPGGRCMVIDTLPAAGMASLFSSKETPKSPGDSAPTIALLKKQGFVAVRVLAERDGLRFVEAIKKNN
jgi:ubiquinone/menaquinone biosynthesis C-methylase UbiE